MIHAKPAQGISRDPVSTAVSRGADRHRKAVMTTLSWADRAAAAGQYADAIAWLDVVTAIGDELPGPYPARRAAWQAALTDADAPAHPHRDQRAQVHRTAGVIAAPTAA